MQTDKTYTQYAPNTLTRNMLSIVDDGDSMGDGLASDKGHLVLALPNGLRLVGDDVAVSTHSYLHAAFPSPFCVHCGHMHGGGGR